MARSDEKPKRQPSAECIAKSAAARRAKKARGMAAATAWRIAHNPSPAIGHIPFEGHRTCAEVAADEARA